MTSGHLGPNVNRGPVASGGVRSTRLHGAGGAALRVGYLTAWAARDLLTGHRFRPGAYQVGNSIGVVYYYSKHQELRLGLPLTITKTNLGIYANKL